MAEKRLIDANALKVKAFADPDSGEGFVYVQDIDEAPTVDAVEVLKCKDCIYWGDEDGLLTCSDGLKIGRCTRHNYLINGRHTGWCPAENDFCSCGERRTDG